MLLKVPLLDYPVGNILTYSIDFPLGNISSVETIFT